MKKLVLSGFIFLSGVIMICTWFIINGTFILYPGVIMVLIGISGFLTTDYKND